MMKFNFKFIPSDETNFVELDNTDPFYLGHCLITNLIKVYKLSRRYPYTHFMYVHYSLKELESYNKLMQDPSYCPF